MPSNFARSESIAADDLHLYANVFHLHECTRMYPVIILFSSSLWAKFNLFSFCSLFQLNIHRFKVLARFGLMHICATNICVWIRTLVLESLKEITLYYQKRQALSDEGVLLDSIRSHTLKHAGTVLGTHSGLQFFLNKFSENQFIYSKY